MSNLNQQQIQKLKESGIFDAKWYFNAYPDVGLSGLDPLDHFLRIGIYMGRDPNPEYQSKNKNQTFAEMFIENVACAPCFHNKISNHKISHEKYVWCPLNLTDSKCIDIIIPVYNSLHWLDLCLGSLKMNIDHNVNKVLVIDDGSESQETLSLICNKYEFCELHHKPKAYEGGFGSTCNYGASIAEAPIVLFLNTDCLVTKNIFSKFITAFRKENVVLACPLSNNSPCLTLPMLEGSNYIEMNQILEDYFVDNKNEESVYEACTITGNCLAVRKDFFQSEGGFSLEWGRGYGEETDLHLKAFAKGLLGVAMINAYVYHFGGGTFSSCGETQDLKNKNYNNFISKWNNEYQRLSNKIKNNDPVNIAIDVVKKVKPICSYDVIIYIPCINQTIGGIHVAVNICNNLVRNGMKASCAIVGDTSLDALMSYKEPLFFNFLLYNTNNEFIESANTIRAKFVGSTLYSSAEIVDHFTRISSAFHFQLIQGYEVFFDNGTVYSKAKKSYSYGNHFIVTSKWLENMIARHIDSNKITRLPISIDSNIFYNRKFTRNKIMFVLRHSEDKGQYLIMEIIDRLVSEGFSNILITKAPQYDLPSTWEGKVEVVELPLSQLHVAELLNKSKIFVDASLHEGYGLMPYEASCCGCWVISSDSGGIHDFLVDGQNADIIKEINKPEVFVDTIIRRNKMEDLNPIPISSLPQSYDNYYEFFKEQLL